MRATSLSGHPRPQHPPGRVHPGSQQVSPPRWELPHTGCEAQPEAGGQGLARPLSHTLPKPGGRGQARSRAERELVRSDTASILRPGQWRLASRGLSTRGLRAGQAGPLPARPGRSLPLSGTRDAASTPDGPGGSPAGTARFPSPLGPGSGSPRALQSGPPIRPPSPEPRAPPRLLLAVCARTRPLRWPPSVALLHLCGFCPGVDVSVCPSPCACGSWRRHGVHAGTEPAVGHQRGGQRPDQLTPGPLSPVVGAGVLRSDQAVC